MTKREKFLILFKIFLILVFLLVLPLIILNAKGYKYNYKAKKFELTGLLILKSTPASDLKIYIDGKLQNKYRTPLKVTLFSGEYRVKIEKEGFVPWEKFVKIEKGKITYEENIILLPENLDISLLKEDVKEFVFVQSFKKVATTLVSAPQKIIVTNLQNQDKNIVYQGKNPSLISFSPNGESLLATDILQAHSLFFLINLKDNTEVSFSGFSKMEFIDNDQLIGLDQKGNLYLLSLVRENKKIKKDKEIILNSSVSNFEIKDNNQIFFIKNENKQLFLKTQNINSKDEKLIKEVKSPEIKIVKSETGGKVAIICNKEELLIFKNNEFITLDNRVVEAYFNKNGDRLIYRKNYEIWVFYIKKDGVEINQKELVLRISEKISHFIFYPDEFHILFQKESNTQKENSLWFCELDGKNLTKILENIRKNSSLILNIKNFEVFFINSENNLLKINFPEKETFVKILENIFFIR